MSNKTVICLAVCLGTFLELALSLVPAQAIKDTELQEYVRAIKLYDAGRYPQVIQILAPIAKNNTTHVEKADLLFYITMSCMKTSRHAEAIKYFDQLIPLHEHLMKTGMGPPDHYRQLYLMDYVHKAKCLFYLGNYEASDKTLQQALKFDPDCESALYDRILVLTELHRNQELADDITKLLALLDRKTGKRDEARHILISQARRIEILYKRSKAYAALGQAGPALKDKLKADKLSEEY